MKQIVRVALILFMIGLYGSCTWIQRRFAPKFAEQGIHAGARQMSESHCLGCHREGLAGAPKAPEKMLKRKNCVRCHLKSGGTSSDSAEIIQPQED